MPREVTCWLSSARDVLLQDPAWNEHGGPSRRIPVRLGHAAPGSADAIVIETTAPPDTAPVIFGSRFQFCLFRLALLRSPEQRGRSEVAGRERVVNERGGGCRSVQRGGGRPPLRWFQFGGGVDDQALASAVDCGSALEKVGAVDSETEEGALHRPGHLTRVMAGARPGGVARISPAKAPVSTGSRRGECPAGCPGGCGDLANCGRGLVAGLRRFPISR